MPVRMECPACGQKIVRQEADRGRPFRCPACDSAIGANATGISREAPTRVERPLPAAIPERPASSTRRRRREPRAGGDGVAALVLGILALVLGIPALAVSWVPFICVFSLVIAGIGLLLGIVGIVLAVVGKKSGLGLSLGGGSVNLLALVVAIVMTIVTGHLVESFPTPADPQPGNFVEVDIPDWGRAIDVDGDCTIVPQGAVLTISVPPTAHDLSAELGKVNAPRVLQEVAGDFRIQVKVCGQIQPLADAAIPGRLPYQAGGLLLWSDRDNYLRLERASLNRGGVLQSYASLEQRAAGQVRAMPPFGLADRDAYLRLERRGNQIIGSVSTDGQNWAKLQPMNAALPPRVRIGVAAINAAQQPLQLRFEELRIER